MRIADLAALFCGFALFLLVILSYGFNVGIEEKTAAYREIIMALNASNNTLKRDCR